MSLSAEVTDTGRIKGIAFREFLVWWAERYGQQELDLRCGRLPEAQLSELSPGRPGLGVLASRWYPAVTVHALLDEMVAGLSAAERRTLAMQGSQAVMDATLRGVYKVLFQWMASPKRYAKYSSKLWTAYYDSGEFRVALLQDGLGAKAEVKGWASHHPFMCELNWGAATAIYTAMGMGGVTTERPACAAQGDDACRFVSRWSP